MIAALGLGMSGKRTRRHILGDVFYSSFTNVFFIIVTFFKVFNVFQNWTLFALMVHKNYSGQ